MRDVYFNAKKVIPRLAEKLKGFVNTFYGGM